MIKITKTSRDGLYVAQVSPPHGPSWSTESPCTGTALMYALEAIGVHQVDLMDALDDADREWERSHAGGVRHE